jgi:hypothetical protein
MSSFRELILRGQSVTSAWNFRDSTTPTTAGLARRRPQRQTKTRAADAGGRNFTYRISPITPFVYRCQEPSQKNAAALPDGKPCVAEGLKFQQAPVTISLAHGKRKAPPAAAGFESSLCDLLHI